MIYFFLRVKIEKKWGGRRGKGGELNIKGKII